jgi:C1A family cysteine protease
VPYPLVHAPINHVILLVGYDSRDGRDYWIAQNNWGKNWGNDGFFYLMRTDEFKNDKIGQCGILSGAYYPIIR